MLVGQEWPDLFHDFLLFIYLGGERRSCLWIYNFTITEQSIVIQLKKKSNLSNAGQKML